MNLRNYAPYLRNLHCVNIIDAMPAQIGRPPKTLECSQVSKSRGRMQVLRRVEFSVARGESIAIVGENGSGKSTLMDLCAGLLRPDEGRVRRARRTGLCPQQRGLVDLLTIAEHVRLVADATDNPRQAAARVRSLLAELDLDADLPTTVSDLSGGQQQKLNVGLSIANDPQLLLLDEPYQGFDHRSYVSLWGLIDRWKDEGRSVVLITHLLAEHERVDRVLTLRDGELQ